jgi:ribosomal protein L16 Arg81 hydroxylase
MSRYVDWYEVMLEPGDVLYNPPFYWHHVANITDNVSVGVRWYSFRDAMQAAPLKNILSFMATNPTLFEASRNAIEYGKTHGSKKRQDLRD